MSSEEMRSIIYSQDENRIYQLKYLMKKYKFRPSRRKSQHFMINYKIMEDMIKIAEISNKDVVLDIGAGDGELTERIARYARRVYAIEYDRTLCKILRRRFKKSKKVKIIEGDFLKIDIPFFNKIVSNPPFHISSEILFKIFEYDFEVGVMTFQKEFAERIIARPGEKKYGRLSVVVQLIAEVRIYRDLEPEIFYPSPKTFVSILKIRPYSRDMRLRVKRYGRHLAYIFTQRRRKVRKVVKEYLRKYDIDLDASDIKRFLNKMPKKRVFQLTPEEALEISINIANILKK